MLQTEFPPSIYNRGKARLFQVKKKSSTRLFAMNDNKKDFAMNCKAFWRQKQV